MDEKQRWGLRLPDMLGQLKLGMSRDEVQSFNSTFGAPEKIDDRSNYAAGAETALAEFAEFFSENDTQQAISTLRQVEARESDVVIEYRRQDSPILEFRSGLLSAIRTDSRCNQLNLDGFPVYGMPPQHVVRRLVASESQPMIIDNSLLFPSQGVELVDFAEELSGSAVRLVAPNTPSQLRFLNLMSSELIRNISQFYHPVALSALPRD